MDEYIKREDALKAITWNGLHEPSEVIHLTLLTAQKNIRKIPAADVVSRAELAIMSAQYAGCSIAKKELERDIEILKIVVKTLKTEVAREIFEEIEKTLNRKMARSKPQFERLNDKENSLSIWGYKDMGYFQGVIGTCEDIQDLLAELKKKYTE